MANPDVSVIIPTHNPQYLKETIESVLGQTHKDFEIVVVPNHGAVLNGEVPDDPRIRIVEYDSVANVGAIKRFAFKAGRGRVLVELDHDDLLAPNALAKISETLQGDIDFTYSNFGRFQADGKEPFPYQPKHGWRYRKVEVLGRKLNEHIAFDPEPGALGHIGYAPNHVRAWTKDGYLKAGGHDPEMKVADDHDLVVRSFLTGKMKRIDSCLYLYREGAGQTYRLNAREIAQRSWRIYERNIEKLVLRWADLQGLPTFDLGGGHNPRAGWIPVDLEGAEIKADLTKTWPWKTSSVGAFRACDLLEHLPDKMHTLSEMHRCLVPGGWALTLTPSTNGLGAHMDPTHVSYWNLGSWWYVTRKDFASYIRNTTVRFLKHRLVEDYPSQWHKNNGIPYITFDGVCIKDGYDGPGLREI